MKIQCSCGTKVVIDVTPDMANAPVTFVCPNCGVDSSAFVNELVRRELEAMGQELKNVTTPPVSTPVEAPAPAPAAAGGSRLKISHAAPAAAPEKKEEAPLSKFCAKHPRETTVARCVVCQKPICPKCMELFGYLCSPLCKARAEAQNIDVPFFEGQRNVVEKQYWRKMGTIAGAIAAVLALLAGFWTWYSWVGSVPHPYLSVRFDDRAYAGQSAVVGDQLVFLHGGTLARYDLKTKKQVWRQELIGKQQIDEAIKAEDAALASLKQPGDSDDGRFNIPADKREAMVRFGLESILSLRVSGQNVWVLKPDKLTRFDWNNGNAAQEIPVTDNVEDWVLRNDELVGVRRTEVGAQFVTHINLANGETRTEEFHEPGISAVATTRTGVGTGDAGAATGGLPLSGADAGKPLDPQKVAQQAQRLQTPAKMALPALLANAMHQQQVLAALKDSDSRKAATLQQQADGSRFELVPTDNGYLQFAVRLIEQRIVTHDAMKAPPKKSALNGDLNASQMGEVANELLNEMQRNAGGNTVTEDESRYQVTLRRAGADDPAEWTGEVIGPPELHALKTVTVLTAGKTVTVFDKSNKKLWQASLTYSLPEREMEFGTPNNRYGDGPCVEHGDTLYVLDQAVLTAFDLATGNARWRVPTVGGVGMFFDDKDMLYLNTTTGSPDDVKYSRQIDITKKTEDVVMKIDSKTGKTLWTSKPGAPICYVSGKFIYAAAWHQVSEDEEHTRDTMGITGNPSFTQIRRINPGNGHVLWDHYQDRAALDVQFNNNQIDIVFRKEVQVLKFLAF